MTDLNPVDAMTNPYRAMCAELLSSGDAMTTDYRTMCAKLVDALESGIPARRIRLSPLADRARALLAQPEPEELTKIALQMLGTIESMGLIIPEITDTIRKALEQGRPTPQPPADGELTVNLRMDLSSECLKRLCDGLAAAVKPNGGYRALTTDDDISGEFIGEQQVGVEWWLPEHGCDSLENTLDSIKGRLFAAVRDWLPTASQPATHWLPLNALPTPTPEAQP
jgi:hypothetical protein